MIIQFAAVLMFVLYPVFQMTHLNNNNNNNNNNKARQTSYLFQRISVLVQRFNAVLLHDSLPAADCTD